MSTWRATVAAAVAVTLASTSLYVLFIGVTWFWSALGATIVVAAVGLATRLRRLPAIVTLAAAAVALVLYLNIVFEAGASLGHLLPTGASLSRLAALVPAGMAQASKYAPPAPQQPGLLLLATGGIGIVAVATDLIAVRLRHVALAGIPLLALVVEPFAISASRSWVGTLITFCLGAAGYLAMLSSENRERIRAWEQPRPGASVAPDTSALSAAGRRVGLASVVLALIVPLAIPGLHTTRLLGGGPGIGGKPTGGGGGTAVAGFPSPETAMSSQLHESKALPVLSYRAEAGDAQASPQYLQLYVLDQLTAGGWTVADDSQSQPCCGSPLPQPPGLQPASAGPGSSQNVATQVTIAGGVDATTVLNGKTVSALPVPYPARTVSVPGSWQVSPADLTLYSAYTSLSDLRYQVNSLALSPAPQALAADGPAGQQAAGYLSVPASYRGLRQVALAAAGNAGTPWAKAVALQAFFDAGAFSYTLNAPSVTNAAQMAAFLTSTRHGYCQQFAVSMAVLARLLGIPSRVVVGFTSGTRQRDGSYLVTTHDAHEWPELYFASYGWLRFEPTPAGLAGQDTATVPAYAKQAPSASAPGGAAAGGSAVGGASGTATPSVAPRTGLILPPGLELPVSGSGPAAARKPGGPGAWAIAGLVLAALAAVGLASPGLARLAIRRRRWRRAARAGDAALAHAAWRELRDDLADLRAGAADSETPRAVTERVSALLRRDEQQQQAPAPDEERALAGVAAGAGEAGGGWTAAETLPGPDGPAAAPAGGSGSGLARMRSGIAALERIALAEERARYAASPLPGGQLHDDVTALRRALAAASPGGDRWRARVLPLSVLTPAAAGVSQAADLFGRVSVRNRVSAGRVSVRKAPGLRRGR